MTKKLLLFAALLATAVGMKANSEVYLTKNSSSEPVSKTVTLNSTDYTVTTAYTLTTEQAPNTGYDYTLFALPYTDLGTALGGITASSSNVTCYYPTATAGTYETKGDNWFAADGTKSTWSGSSKWYIQEITTDENNFTFWVGQQGASGKTSSIGDSYTSTFYMVNGTNAVEVSVMLSVVKATVQINGSASDASWTSSSSTSAISAGSYVQLDGVKMTFGNYDDNTTNWTWNSGNTGMIPSQMPTTDGTSSTLITSFSKESPYGTLPTRGNYFKIEATKTGKVTISCKPSTDGSQSLVWVEMNGEDIVSAAINTSVSTTSFTYDVEADKTYYFFQLAKSGQLSGYRMTMRGMSFVEANREPQQINAAATDLAWTPSSSSASIVAGDFVQLSGLKFTLGSSDDENTAWSWTAGNAGMVASQMPSTNGTSGTLITTFSDEAPYGTLPTRGNFFKVEATESGLLTVLCKPSTDSEQKLVFLEMSGSDIASVIIDANIWAGFYNYQVEAGKTYYIFQLSKSGQLTSYRYTLRGISFQKQILSEDATYTPADMVGITAITLKRTIGANKWNTIVLPVALTNAQLTAAFGANVKVAELTEASTEALTFQSVTATEANKPYMIYVDQDFSEATITGITVVDGTPSQTVGTATFIGSYNALTDIPEGAYFASNNQVVKAGTSCTMKGTRAYFTVNSAAEARTLLFVIDGGETTGVQNVKTESQQTGLTYGLQGRRTMQPTKGLYIVSGKKVIIK